MLHPACTFKKPPGKGPDIPSGVPRRYSDLIARYGLVIRDIFRLLLRATAGLMRSVIDLLDVALETLDYRASSRRAAALTVPRSDSTRVGPLPCRDRHHRLEGVRRRMEPAPVRWRGHLWSMGGPIHALPSLVTVSNTVSRRGKPTAVTIAAVWLKRPYSSDSRSLS